MFNMVLGATGEDEKSINQVLRERRSIRAFKRYAEVDVNTLNKILEICDLAPASGGLKTFEIYQIKNGDMKKQLVTVANNQAFIRGSINTCILFRAFTFGLEIWRKI
jgi:nitroreductase